MALSVLMMKRPSDVSAQLVSGEELALSVSIKIKQKKIIHVAKKRITTADIKVSPCELSSKFDSLHSQTFHTHTYASSFYSEPICK